MKDRLQHFIELEGISPSKLADILEIQRSGLSHILSGRNNPGFDFIHKLLTCYPLLNAEWLITGRGNVYKENIPLMNTNFVNSESEQLIDKSTLFTHNEDITVNNEENQLIENSKFKNSLHTVSEKRILSKVLFFYSDDTFEEFNPNKE